MLNLKSYASYFISYILDNLKETENIERIILFGSVAKEEATKESDIDIFIEPKRKNINIEKEIKSLEESFYKSRESSLFKIRDIENKFSIKIGKLKDWKDLHRSIASTGITLYGTYEAKETPAGLRHQIIIFWEKIGKNRGSFLNKLYGFNVKGKHYAGLIEKLEGKKLGKSCILLPIKNKETIFKLIKKHEVKAKIIEAF